MESDLKVSMAALLCFALDLLIFKCANFCVCFCRFAGTLERAAAELELDNKTDGTFLVRESVNRRGEYALSVQ